jgi:hypothetical protein
MTPDASLVPCSKNHLLLMTTVGLFVVEENLNLLQETSPRFLLLEAEDIDCAFSFIRS